MPYTQSPHLSDEEIENLLEKAMVARFCSLNANGTIHAVPVWYSYLEGELVVARARAPLFWLPKYARDDLQFSYLLDFVSTMNKIMTISITISQLLNPSESVPSPSVPSVSIDD